MKKLIKILPRLEFEYRIFISLGIVIFTCFLSFNYFAGSLTIIQLFGTATQADTGIILKSAFVFLGMYLIPLSLLRMWAGSLLNSDRVMSFGIVDDLLVKEGPYTLTRNPIYFSDIAAISGFSLCLPLPGLIMPFLFYFHYKMLIKYEQKKLAIKFEESYADFLKSVPELIPNQRSTISFLKSKKKFYVNSDGFRYNSLYILFIPGFLIAALTGSFITAIIIGTPGVLYWAVTHTIKGTKKNNKVSGLKVFKGVLYAQCWEDPNIDRAAFNISEDDVIFSITSGGCNVLSFLIDNPARIIALDLNPHQNYLLELKMAAINNLNRQEYLAFIGFKGGIDRLKTYNSFKYSIKREAMLFWDSNPGLIKKGIIHCGRYENYMKLLRRFLYLLIGKKTIVKFFNTFGHYELEKLYLTKWKNRRWELFTKILLSRKTMSLLFTRKFFTYVPEDYSFGENFALKTRVALTRMPLRSNYFLSYILLGHYFDENNVPPYLKPGNYELIKGRLDRIKIVNGRCEEYFDSVPAGCISKFNFTNIFEWMSEKDFEILLEKTFRTARNNAVITYRNLLVPREHPPLMDEKVKSHKLQAEALHRKDRSFIYNNYVIEEVIKKEEACLTQASLPYPAEK